MKQVHQRAGTVGGGVFGQHAATRADGDRASVSGAVSSAASVSCVELATMISRPGSKKVSSPVQASLRMGVPQAAASNRRPDGHQPMRAMEARVTFSVMRDEP